MYRLFQIITNINLILCLSIGKINSNTISDQFKDSNNNSYDNTFNHTTTANVQFNEKLSTRSHLEESIVTANEIEYTTPYASPGITWDTEEKLLENSLVKLKSANDENNCLLDSLKTALLWWCYSNGTLRESNLKVLKAEQQLDLSFHNISSDEKVLELLPDFGESFDIVAASLAYNNLTAAPFQSLQMMAKSLKYLSLKGNPFIDINNEAEGIAWATFPYMPSLMELDISNCNIEFISKRAFQNLTNLKSLYMSYNKMLTIKADTFFYTPSLQVLDLSFTNVYDSFMNQLIASPTLESVMKLMYGVNIQQNTFKFLPNLIYLDLSHTKLTRGSAVAFTHIGPSVKYLSLCYTSFPVFGNGIFKNSSLIGLDLSGNTHAAFSITEDVFEDMSKSLSYLYFEKSNLKDLSWLKHLHNLRFLALAGNNINTLSVDHFSNLKQLQILDLTSNQVGNWYSQVFVDNENLRVLSLKDNNINIITSEMLKDFSHLVYLSLGDNNFICDCLLRDLVDIAAVNNQEAKCKGNLKPDLLNNIHLNNSHVKHILEHSKLFFNSSLRNLDIHSLVWSQNLLKLKQSAKKLTKTHSFKSRPKMRFILDAFNSFNGSKACHHYNSSDSYDERINSSLFKVQLLDYEEEHYWCYNETERQTLIRLDCQRTSLVEDIVQELDSLTTYVMASVGSLIAVAILAILIYWKRWHIYYYYSSLKSAALLSAVSQDNINKFNNLCDQNPNMIYDIFISYCQSDRDWIVEELMPNVEETGDISICLHERDFQIGVTILDNIVSCMERSRALMLIISSNFLLSHWCQFEMQLAQHRIFDLNKDHLILVLLEEIPRSKRPKNLQYLMDVKTYIKWPGGKAKRDIHPEERKLFWKRLKRTLKNIGLNPTESRA
ncbi:toll-like receptor 2 [Calliphora vicina]|uniref:toll-like receptor 2 n=1 Tax=Calliphora vicina TaxID=7373 RepID=UPI00325AC3FB